MVNGGWVGVGGGVCRGSAADPQNWHKVQACVKGAGLHKMGFICRKAAEFNPEGQEILKQCRLASTLSLTCSISTNTFTSVGKIERRTEKQIRFGGDAIQRMSSSCGVS